jgi:hypothetical protein
MSYENPCEECGEFAGSWGETYCDECREDVKERLTEKIDGTFWDD